MSGGPIMIGPKSPTVNTPLKYSFPADTIAIYVQNYTRYTLLVNFSDTQPTATDSLNNQYDGVLAAGGRDVFYVQSRGASAAERSLNSIGAFTGVVWIMAIDRTPSQANVGTVSGTNDIWISAYGPYDPPPPITGGMPLNVDLSSQPRVIALPPPGGQCVNGQWLAGTFPTFQITTLFLSTKMAAQLNGWIYLYHLSIFPKSPGGATPLATDFELAFTPQNAGHADLDVSTGIFFGQVASYRDATNHQLALTPCIITPHFPLAIPMTLPATTVQLKIALATTSGSPVDCWYNVAVDIDQNNLITPPSYGGPVSGYAKWSGSYTQLTGLW